MLLLQARSSDASYYIQLTPDNFMDILTIIPQLRQRSESIWKRFQWLLLELGRNPGDIQVIQAEYFDRLIRFAFHFHDAKSNNNFIENFIYTTYCQIDNNGISIKRTSPIQCAENSGMIRFDQLGTSLTDKYQPKQIVFE